jgi:hypothetical protein
MSRQTEAAKQLIIALDHGLVCRHRYVGMDEMSACPLATISPEVRRTHTYQMCPPTLIPRCIAYRIPLWCDGGSERRWEPLMRRLARLIGASTELFRDRSRMRRLDRAMNRIERERPSTTPTQMDELFRLQFVAWAEAIRNHKPRRSKREVAQ